jgi:pimeloyl-ACP methyl ester carboxylesterase
MLCLFEQRGTGTSEINFRDYSIEGSIEDIEAITQQHFHLNTFPICGHSWGGLHAQTPRTSLAFDLVQS